MSLRATAAIAAGLPLVELKYRYEDAARQQPKQKKLGIVDFSEQHFYVPETGEPVVLLPHQRAIFQASLTPKPDGHLPYSLIIFSSIKKAGKTAMAAMVARWIAEERTQFGEIFTLGNDMRQARERVFEKVAQSIKLMPGYKRAGAEGVLPGRWHVQTNKLSCLLTDSKIEALSVDAAGEAGANQDLSCWTELWAFEYPAAVAFFHEMTPPPTKPDSIRLVDTYAGFDGESLLLRSLYDLGMLEGRQLYAGELAEMTGISLGAFEEAAEEDQLVPIWVNEAAGLFMWWDSGVEARRMPWLCNERGDRYYQEEALKLPPAQMQRIHGNFWVGGESDFIPMAQWDGCKDPTLPFLPPGDKTPCVLGVDAATSHDCFGVVLVSRHPAPERHKHAAVRACRKWSPPKGGKIDYDEPEAFIRTLCHGGCMNGHPQYPPFRKRPEDCTHSSKAFACEQCCQACRDGALVPRYNIIEVTYDPYQLESMMGRLYRDKHAVNTQAFNQGRERMIADSMLHDEIMSLRLAHDGNLELREHIQNAGAKYAKDEDTKLRMIKKGQGKIDLAVCVSQAVRRILYLNISRPREA